MIPDLNVLIIGGNRFVGKLLASKLLAQGHHLTLLNRGNLDDGFGNRVERINCDRNNTIDLVNAISGRRWDVIYDQLCFGVKQAEQACELFKNKTQQYIFSSSQAVYGLGAQLREENFNPRKYKILGVSHDYTKGKQQAEAYLYAHAPWPVIAARLPIIIGSDEQNGRLAFHLARMRSEREIFFPTLDAHISLISAEGAADCLAFFLGKEINEPVNCAPVESISLADFKSMLESVIKKPMLLATKAADNNYSPYSVASDWSMSVEKLTALGHQVPTIQDWLPAIIRATDDVSLIKTLKNKPSRAIGLDIEQASLKGQTIVITGSSRGFGHALAFNLAHTGAHIVINGRHLADVNNTVENIRQAGYTAIGICADIGTKDGANRLIDETIRNFGGVDVLINNAAISGPADKNMWECDPADWQAVMNTNLSASFLCASYTIKWMLANARHGKIINVLDDSTFLPKHRLGPYKIAKTALESLTRAMADQLDGTDINVIGIKISSMQTERIRSLRNEEAFDRLPPPDTHSPVFIHALTSATTELHGKVLTSRHFNFDRKAEIKMNQASVMLGPLRFAERYYPGGEEIDRSNTEVQLLDWGESPFGTSAKARQAFAEAEKIDLSRYPRKCDYIDLRGALAKYLSLPLECFAVGPGSNELIERILRCFVQPGTMVVSNTPTYFAFENFCRAMGIFNFQVPFCDSGDGLDHNLDTIAKVIDKGVRLIYLVSPGNPIGIGLKKRKFLEFLEKIPKHIPIIVDEAYIEFSDNPDLLLTNEIIQQSEHCLIGIRTFSKAFGLAGLRVGYAFSSPDNIRILERLEPMVAISSVSERVAIAALSDKEHLINVRRQLDLDRQQVQKRLGEAGIGFIPVETPYLPVLSPVEPTKVIERLETEGIYISATPLALADNFIRITLGKPEVSQRIVDTIISLKKDVID